MSPTEEIKKRLGIIEVVSEYLKLQKAGSNYRALCPFHHEKTPSFFVSPERGFYYCFGCGAKGDIFTFVENFEGLDFRGALKVLAEKAGVTLAEFKENNRLYSLLELAARFYEVNLNEPAKKYLRDRGLVEETIKTFRIGYAPDSFHALSEYLKKKGFTEPELLEVGLLKKTERGKIDHFRGRIMFPITDSAGRVIAFSGRIFPEKEKAPKYLNSPETPLFKKGTVLYGFDKAKFAVREAEQAILVEGQMDLVLLHQSGFKNTVALSGTALSEVKGHLKELFFLSPNLILAFDSDSAGRKAALRAAEIVLAYGFDVKIANLPAGLDPADIAKKGDFKKYLGEASHVVLFLTNLILSETKDPREIGKRVKAEVLPFIARLPSSIEASHFVKKVSELAGVREESIWEDLKRLPKEKGRPEEKKKVDAGILRRLLGILYWQESLVAPVTDIALLKKELAKLGVATEPKDKDELIFEAESFYSQTTDLSRTTSELLLNLEEDLLEEEFRVCLAGMARHQGREEEEKKLLRRCQEISERINEIKTLRAKF
jgi:DNA primase